MSRETRSALISPDGRYYIRAGAHTTTARHFIVDAIWAKRHYAKPRLSHVFRLKPGQEQIVQLGIVALTPAPAVDVKVDIAPLGELMKGLEKYFPLEISVVDRDNSFFSTLQLGFKLKSDLAKTSNYLLPIKTYPEDSTVSRLQ